jgi:ribonuclease Y
VERFRRILRVAQPSGSGHRIGRHAGRARSRFGRRGRRLHWLWFVLKARARGAQARRARAQEMERIRAAAEREGQTVRVQAEVTAREEALVMRTEAEVALRTRQVELAELEAALAGRTVLASEESRILDEIRKELADREVPLAEIERETKGLEAELDLAAAAAAQRGRARGQDDRTAQATQTLVDAEIEEARVAAAQIVRNASEGASASEVARAAKRLMGISVGRITDHFYSERAQSIIVLPESRGDRPVITADDLKLVEGVAGVTLAFTEEGDAIRIEGLDGVGREVARRCVGRMLRRPGLQGDAFAKVAREITMEVEREIVDFGQRGFALLKLDRAHADIVKLVGRLNFRTSYTQNQWEHSVEAGFLCGMLAAELGLDVKIARRAALLHDIGKALTHELDGSHAVIGADYARRLGEKEVVANAIGAHHTDEPFPAPTRTWWPPPTPCRVGVPDRAARPKTTTWRSWPRSSASLEVFAASPRPLPSRVGARFASTSRKSA